MKQLKFETSKGEFWVMDTNHIFFDNPIISVFDGYLPNGQVKTKEYVCISKISEITEEQASEIVEWNEEFQFYYLYPKTGWQGDITAIESLHSLIKSKGYLIAENHYIFKLK